MKLRTDRMGSGQYGARRSGGRIHRGVDIIVKEGEPVYAPEAGSVVRRANPYKDDKVMTGFIFRGVSGTEYIVFYAEPIIMKAKVLEGMQIAVAQDVAKKWGGGMLAHIHIEMLVNGAHIDPTPHLAFD